MQAIILAGGYGTRLYPLTLNAPKPMIQVGGKPLVEYLVEKLNNIPEISQIFIVSNDKFTHVFEKWLQEKKYQNITIVNDGTASNEDRLGSIGDIGYVLDHYTIDEDVIILGGDNFFEDNLQGLITSFHEKWNIIALHNEDNLEIIKRFNNLNMDETGKVLNFVEKPENPTSTLHATLVYILRNNTLPYISELVTLGKADRAGDFIAYLCNKEDIYGVGLQWEWFDIGTIETLKKAEEWIELKNK